MPRNQTFGNLALSSFDDIFNVGVNNSDGERITFIALTDLFPPEFHPFNIVNDDAMARLVESVKEYGVREPGIARPRADGGYELLCGNRRKMACELAGINTLPVIIRELDDDCAVHVMVNSNLQQREKLLYSEKAWAYRIKMEALNHNGVKGEQYSFEIMEAQTGEKRNQIFRTIRLTELIPDLIDKVDARKLAFNPAVELSYLSRQEQTAVVDAMAAHEVKPSLSQAVRLKSLKKDGSLTRDIIDSILAETKKPQKGGQSDSIRYRDFFRQITRQNKLKRSSSNC